MFLDNLMRLCGEQGISPTELTAKINISASNVTRWKEGTVPQKRTIKKIADYFKVTVESLLTDRVITTDVTPDTKSLTPDIIEILTDPKLKEYILLTKKAADQGLPPEVLATLIELYKK